MNSEFNYDSQLADAFERFPDRLAIIQQIRSGKSKNCSYSELANISSQIKSLFDQHLDVNQPVGLMMRRSIEHVSCIVAALSSHNPFFCINPLVSVTQILQMCNSSGCKVLICDPSILPRLAPLAIDTANDLRIFCLDDTPLGPIQQQMFDKIAIDTDIRFCNLNDLPASTLSNSELIEPGTPRFYLFTSGSTGTPKGVVIQNENLNSRVANEIDAFQIRPDDRLLNILPFSFDVGLNQLFTSLISGSSLILLNSWLARDILTTIAEHKITGLSGVPTIWQSILESGMPELERTLEHLRYLTISAGDLPQDLRQGLRDKTKSTDIFKTYGQTETFRSGMLFPEEFESKQDSVGRPPKGVQIGILLESGSLGTANEVGEIIHAGAGSMQGYIGDCCATRNKIKPAPAGFDERFSTVVHTGDRGKIDTDGYLYILGRLDRMIKVRGNRVYPEEVESKLLMNSVIVEAVVVKSSYSDSLIAAIVYVPGMSATNEELCKFLSTRLPAYMVPDQYIDMKQLPRTASGKVDLTQLAKSIN